MRSQVELDISRGTVSFCYCCSVAKLCPVLCDPMDYSTPGFPVLHYLLEFAQTHGHWVNDAIQSSHPLLPLLLLPSVFPWQVTISPTSFWVNSLNVSVVGIPYFYAASNTTWTFSSLFMNSTPTCKLTQNKAKVPNLQFFFLVFLFNYILHVFFWLSLLVPLLLRISKLTYSFFSNTYSE